MRVQVWFYNDDERQEMKEFEGFEIEAEADHGSRILNITVKDRDEQVVGMEMFNADNWNRIRLAEGPSLEDIAYMTERAARRENKRRGLGR